MIVRLAPGVGDDSAAFAALVEAIFDAITGSRRNYESAWVMRLASS